MENEWDAFDPSSKEGKFCQARGGKLFSYEITAEKLNFEVPISSKLNISSESSTQEVFGRVITELSRNEQIRPFIVTTAPDVATSTN